MSSEPPVTEPTPAPEFFIDGYYSHSVINGIAKLTFFSLVHDPVTGMTQRRIVLRLTGSTVSMAGVHQGMGEMLEKIGEAMRVR